MPGIIKSEVLPSPRMRPTFPLRKGILDMTSKGGGDLLYLDLLMGLNFLVDLLLLMSTNALAGFRNEPCKITLAAIVGGVYGGVCVVPGFTFLGSILWRSIFLGIMAVIAFGWQQSAVRRGIIFLLLSMALGGVALSVGQKGILSVIGSAAGVCSLCLLGFRGKVGKKKFATVHMSWKGKEKVLTALYDTGNTLRDPISGETVLVVGADIAGDLLKLSPQQLKHPIETVASGVLSGLRLVPYRAVGRPDGMLLAIRMDEMVIDGRKSSTLVAFAPELIGNGVYQALTGGI